MLENSNLIEGKTAKRVNVLLKEYQGITSQLTDLNKSKEKVLEELFNLTSVGTNETNMFTFNIIDNKGRQTISIADVKNFDNSLFEDLNNKGLVKTGQNFLTVKSIKLKGDRV